MKWGHIFLFVKAGNFKVQANRSHFVDLHVYFCGPSNTSGEAQKVGIHVLMRLVLCRQRINRPKNILPINMPPSWRSFHTMYRILDKKKQKNENIVVYSTIWFPFILFYFILKGAFSWRDFVSGWLVKKAISSNTG